MSSGTSKAMESTLLSAKSSCPVQTNPCRAPSTSAKNGSLRSPADSRIGPAWTARAGPWMMLKLADGTWQGTPVIDPAALLEANTPRSMSGAPGTSGSRTGFYGFGTNVGDDYSGRVRLNHSGAFLQGAATNYILLPDQQLGIVVLTNGMPIGSPRRSIRTSWTW